MLMRAPADIGAAIRDRRRQLGLDQATLAGRIGVSRQWVIAIERGRTRAELGLVLRAVAALGLRLDLASGATGEHRKPVATPRIDIDAIVKTAREGRR